MSVQTPKNLGGVTWGREGCNEENEWSAWLDSLQWRASVLPSKKDGCSGHAGELIEAATAHSHEVVLHLIGHVGQFFGFQCPACVPRQAIEGCEAEGGGGREAASWRQICLETEQARLQLHAA